AGVVDQMARRAGGGVRVLVRGIERIRLTDWVRSDPYPIARILAAPESEADAPEVDGLKRALLDVFRRLVALTADLPDEVADAAENLDSTRHVVYFVASLVSLELDARQEVLELDAIPAKLRRLIDLLQRQLAVRELGQQIATETQERLTKE